MTTFEGLYGGIQYRLLEEHDGRVFRYYLPYEASSSIHDVPSSQRSAEKYDRNMRFQTETKTIETGLIKSGTNRIVLHADCKETGYRLCGFCYGKRRRILQRRKGESNLN